MIDTYGTAVVDEEKIAEAVLRHVDLRPAAIIDRFGLRRPIYCSLAAYGHMGREDVNAPWEARDLAPVLKDELLA
jgi:S-adenosylmethionine synthetase